MGISNKGSVLVWAGLVVNGLLSSATQAQSVSFIARLDFATGPFSRLVAVGDFNGDGLLDLAVANRLNRGTVSVLLGNGDGSFRTPQSFETGACPVSLAVGDFNGDGVLDLAVANVDSDNISVLLGNEMGASSRRGTLA